MPLKKSQLYSSLWKSCDELRGGMDASQYKDYILIAHFRRINEHLAQEGSPVRYKFTFLYPLSTSSDSKYGVAKAARG